ncbi:hypothetical protein ACFLQL_00185 [Verrucomicrobiota bacterium]
MNSPIRQFLVYPSYSGGYHYTWEVEQECAIAGPWTFSIEESESGIGDWKKITPDLVNTFAYQETDKRYFPKAKVFHFRLKMVADQGTFYSPTIDPTWQLDRHDFLIVREMMRKELLQQKNASGVLVDIFVKTIMGPKCTCLDPITGDVLNPNHAECHGTGQIPGYFGPYNTWCTFSPLKRARQFKEDNTDINYDDKLNGRMISVPELKKLDIIVDKASDKRYYIDAINNELELRRLPVVQTMVLKIISNSNRTIYDL